MTTRTSPVLQEVFDRLSMMREDINVGPYAVVPEHGGAHGSMAPRGAYVPPETPALGSDDIDDKALVWAENAGELYEESVARQWSSARDVPWVPRSTAGSARWT